MKSHLFGTEFSSCSFSQLLEFQVYVASNQAMALVTVMICMTDLNQLGIGSIVKY